jgi:hypothetical protein
MAVETIQASEVRAIYSEIPASQDISGHIAAATLMCNEDLDGRGLSPARLHMVGIYLAAHMVAMDVERGGLTSSKTGDSEETYASHGLKATGLSSTRWGQMALTLDSTGVLANMSNPGKPKAQFRLV